jgi:probable HAF family extracellular repeat protein
MQLLGPSGSNSYAVAVNASGQVAGNYKSADGVQHLVRWSGGNMTPLADSAQATDLNDAGDVVGWLLDEKGTEAFIYTDRLYLFNLPEGSSRAYAVDSEGRVTGRYTGETEQAFLDEDGTSLMLAPDLDAYAIDMNDAGQILIKELRAGGFHTLLRQTDGSLVDLGTLGGASTQAMDMNESGQIVGWSQTSDGKYQAFSWENGVMKALAEPRWTYSSALAVDDSGNILIKATAGTEKGVYLLKDGELNDLEGLGLDYVEVSDMNNQGQIVGWTVTAGGNFQAFLATPR